jgi:hypothetical protein
MALLEKDFEQVESLNNYEVHHQNVTMTIPIFQLANSATREVNHEAALRLRIHFKPKQVTCDPVDHLLVHRDRVFRVVSQSVTAVVVTTVIPITQLVGVQS